jgi:hypothetical protein
VQLTQVSPVKVALTHGSRAKRGGLREERSLYNSKLTVFGHCAQIMQQIMQ